MKACYWARRGAGKDRGRGQKVKHAPKKFPKDEGPQPRCRNVTPTRYLYLRVATCYLYNPATGIPHTSSTGFVCRGGSIDAIEIPEHCSFLFRVSRTIVAITIVSGRAGALTSPLEVRQCYGQSCSTKRSIPLDVSCHLKPPRGSCSPKDSSRLVAPANPLCIMQSLLPL